MKKPISVCICTVLLTAMLFSACAGQSLSIPEGQGQTAASAALPSAGSEDGFFTKRELDPSYSRADAVEIALLGDSAECASDKVRISGGDIYISDEGTYIISGTLHNGCVTVEAEKTDKLQIVLSGADITSADFAPIYIRQADKVFISSDAGTENRLTAAGTVRQRDSEKVDAAVYSKEDLCFNGEGSLEIISADGHAVVCNDELTICGGSYALTASGHAVKANDGVSIGGAAITVCAGRDGIHCGEDINLVSGSITVSANEGVEGRHINILGGEITVVSEDDGFNASSSNGGWDCSVSISGGIVHIDADGDGIDSNGSLSVTGGELYVSGSEKGGDNAIDFETGATVSGGTVVAAGAVQMAENFGADSTQCSMLINTGAQSGGALIELKDAEGNVLVSYSPEKGYDCVLISSPMIEVGKAYVLTAGSFETELVPDAIVFGGGQGRGGMAPDAFGGKPPQKPDALPQPPEGFGQRPPDAPDKG